MQEKTSQKLTKLIKDPRFLTVLGMSTIFLIIGILGIVILLTPLNNRNSNESERGELLNQEETEEVISQIFKENNLDVLPDQTPSNNIQDNITNRNDRSNIANQNNNQQDNNDNVSSNGNIGFSPTTPEENDQKIQDIENKINDPEINASDLGILRTTSITSNYGPKSEECNLNEWKLNTETISKEYISGDSYLSSYDKKTDNNQQVYYNSYRYDEEIELNDGFTYRGGAYGVNTVYQFRNIEIYNPDSYPRSFPDLEELDSYPGVSNLTNYTYYKIETDSGRTDYLQVFEGKSNECLGENGLNDYISKTYINGDTFEIYQREIFYDGETEDHLYYREEVETTREELPKQTAVNQLYFQEVFPELEIKTTEFTSEMIFGSQNNSDDYEELINFVKTNNYDLLEYDIVDVNNNELKVSLENTYISENRNNLYYNDNYFNRDFYPDTEFGEELWLNDVYFLYQLGIKDGYYTNYRIDNLNNKPNVDFETYGNSNNIVVNIVGYEKTPEISSKDIIIRNNSDYLYGDFTMADPVSTWETQEGYKAELFDYVFDPGYFEMDSFPTSFPTTESYPLSRTGDNSYPIIVITTENSIFTFASQNYDDPTKLQELVQNVFAPNILTNQEVIERGY